MKTQSTHLKRSLPLIGLLFFCFNAVCQSESKNEFTAFWPNGEVTRQADLGLVWIIKTNGKIVKDAKIREYNKAKGKLTYERERTLHDIETFNIKSISKSSNCVHHIYFDKEGNPMFSKNPDYYYGYDHTDFKKSDQPVAKPSTKLPVDTTKVAKALSVPVEKAKSSEPTMVCDTVIKPDGTIVLAKILELSEFEIRYKRMDYLTGPVYNLIINSKTIIKQYEKSKTVIIN